MVYLFQRHKFDFATSLIKLISRQTFYPENLTTINPNGTGGL